MMRRNMKENVVKTKSFEFIPRMVNLHKFVVGKKKKSLFRKNY